MAVAVVRSICVNYKEEEMFYDNVGVEMKAREEVVRSICNEEEEEEEEMFYDNVAVEMKAREEEELFYDDKEVLMQAREEE